MPHYVDDPENHGKKIDVIELWKRNPDKPLPPDPRIIDRLLKRESWTAREVILTLAGYDPDNTDWQDNGKTLVDIPYGRMAYLDGTMAHQLLINGSLRLHPLQMDCLSNVYTLQGYLINEPLTITKTPADWLAWAQSKGHLLPFDSPGNIEPARPQVELVADAETPAPWLTPNPTDPEPAQKWYIPARYFARELVKLDTTLLGKRDILSGKIVERLNQVGIKKRGNVNSFDPGTIKKALSGISF